MTERDAPDETLRRRAIARRVAEAHADRLGRGPLLALLSGSVVEGLADALSDVDMSVVIDAATLPAADLLRAACAQAGSAAWHWQAGELADPDGAVVAFRLDGVEVQIGYATHDALLRDIDRVLVGHDPDTPLHKLAEGLLKAEPLVDDAGRLAALQARLARFPPPLGRAMARHWLVDVVTPWRAASQIVQRDASLWSRELQAECGWRLLGALAGLNGRYFTRFQFKRQHRFIAQLRVAPPAFADRLERAWQATPTDAFAPLHALEGEVLALVRARWPDLDLAPAMARHAAFVPPTPGPDR